MSLDLYVFPPPGPADADEFFELTEEEDDESGGGLVPAAAAFVAEAARRWPWSDDDDAPASQSPWASWPLGESVVLGGTGLRLRWSTPPETVVAIVDLANEHGLVVFDPQTETFSPPPD